MKQLLLASLLSVFLIPHFSYAENKLANHESVKQHHHAHHVVRSHSKADNTQPVDINHADATELTTLKGIGAKKAENILSYRQAHGAFKSLNDLAKVKGVGLKGMARLQKNNPGRLVINASARQALS